MKKENRPSLKERMLIMYLVDTTSDKYLQVLMQKYLFGAVNEVVRDLWLLFLLNCEFYG
jgi:hypothetical protein